MKVILMAAGVGSRISRSVNRPKCTLEISDGCSLVKRNIQIFKEMGFEVGIIIGFMKEIVLEEIKNYDIQVFENPFYRVTNSIGSLWFAKDFLKDDDVILCNADVYWEKEMIIRLVNSQHDYTMLGDKTRKVIGDFFFGLDKDFVKKYGKEISLEDRDTEYVGFALVKAHGMKKFYEHLEQLIDEEKYNLWWENVLYEYLDETPVYVIDVSDLFWSEIDYIEDYNRIIHYLETGNVECKLEH